MARKIQGIYKPIYKGDIGWQERYREYIKSVNEFGLAQEIRKQSLIDY